MINCRSLEGVDKSAVNSSRDLRLKILGKSQSVAAGFLTSESLFEALLYSSSDTHRLRHGAHLGTEFVFSVFKFFKCPARELYHDVVTRRSIPIQGAVSPIGYFVQRQTAGKLGRYKRDGKPVALEARAEEREVRGFISMTTTRSVFGSWAN